jgi:hypothetical protein
MRAVALMQNDIRFDRNFDLAPGAGSVKPEK